MTRGGPPLIGALISFAAFGANVALGAAGAGAPLGDAGEMLTLFAACLFFTWGVLAREAATPTRTGAAMDAGDDHQGRTRDERAQGGRPRP
jgi:hypothetical protein